MKIKEFIILAAIIVGSVLSNQAATITVTNTSDLGAGSLRNAVASAASAGDTIDFNLSGCPCTILLTSGQISINKSLTINGLGADMLTVSGNNSSRVFFVNIGMNPVILNDLTIANGRATTEGGGIANLSALTINNSVIRDNTTTFVSGGGIFSATNALTLNNCVVSGNSSNGDGGGVYITQATTSSIIRTNFTNNNAVGGSGGGLYVDRMPVSIANTNFQNNTALTGGGIANNGVTTINGGNIESNQATDGGGVYNLSTAIEAVLTMNSVTIQNNTATGKGGGFYNYDLNNIARLVINSGSLVAGNQAASGGGIYNEAILTVFNTTISGNSANEGGGLYVNFFTDVSGTTFNGNTALRGGGIYNIYRVNLTNSTLSGNQATGNGIDDGGGAIFSPSIPFGPSTTLVNSTVTGNSSATKGGGIRCIQNISAAGLKNTIVALNTAPTSPDFDGNFFSFGFNLIGNPNGAVITGTTTGNQLNVNPLIGALSDNGGYTQTRALLAGSPAINAGTNDGAPMLDQRGLTRPMGGTTDIGAFEVNECGSTEVANTNDSGPGSLRCAVLAAFTDGVINFDLPAGSTITLSSEILIDKPIFIDGTTVPNLTISGGNAVRVFRITAPVSLNGLTISGGRADRGGAILNTGNLTVNESFLTDNVATEFGGAIINENGATLEIIQSTFFNNSSAQGGALYNLGTGVIRLTNSTLSGNTSVEGGGIYTNTPEHRPNDYHQCNNCRKFVFRRFRWRHQRGGDH